MRRKGKYGTIVHKNLAVLDFLSNHGTWANPNQIRVGSGGFNPADVMEILDGLMTRKFIEDRPANNPQAKTEYRVTETGRQMFSDLMGVLGKWTGSSHMLGIPEKNSLELPEKDSLGLPEPEEK